jgi:manganese oxidase
MDNIGVKMNKSRRNFLRRSTAIGAAGIVANTQASAQHEHHVQQQPQAPPKKNINTGTTDHNAIPLVYTPDIGKLPWTLDNGVKVFHLTAEVVKTELLPGKEMYAWGYNGSVPGPTIEIFQGDRVRIIFHNKLPEGTTMHWHGLEVPLNMDGAPFISQPIVEPGGTFIYEFTLHQNGTFFYHSHMAMQEMMGMIGLFIIHPKVPYKPIVHRDFGLILQEWALLPNNPIPNTLAMEFNWLTINGKAGPATTPLIVKQGERVRIRMVNLGMDHHPMHIHGNQFYVTGTEGGRIPESAWFPGNTVLVGVAQARDIEFDAIYPGEWMLHCHLPHHMMNQMVSMVGPMAHAGHGIQTGKGMEEGMGMVTQGHALSEDLGPGLGRGMGMSTQEKNTSNLIGQDKHSGHGQKTNRSSEQGMGQQVQPGQVERLGALTKPDEKTAKRVPGYPQDMIMIMDKEVAKPETYGLPPGWTAAMMGMMTLVRVLTPEMYEEVMRRIREGISEPPKGEPLTGGKHQHQHE